MDRHLAPSALRDALEADVRAGLTSTPKTLPPKWFYDARGSQLFDEITRLPEYYPTRRERAILQAHATDIAALVAADTLVELGSGTWGEDPPAAGCVAAGRDAAALRAVRRRRDGPGRGEHGGGR